MYFRVSQAPSRYYWYGLVCALCFQDLLQRLEVLLICTYCTSSHHRTIYFENQDLQGRHRTPNIIEGIVGVHLCMLFLLQICRTYGTANTTFS